MLAWIALVVGAYLIGSIPFGVLIGRTKGVDIRQHGSRNIGATNVGRVLGRRLGALCFVLDVSKGAVPVLAAGWLMGVLGRRPQDLAPVETWWWLAVACSAFCGHVASIFLRFAGGKGVATGFGAMVAMWPILTLPAIAALVIWYATLRLSRYVAVASMVAAMSVPIWYAGWLLAGADGELLATLQRGSPPLVVAMLLAALVVWRHRTNIARLRRGEEPRAGERLKPE